MQSCDKWEIFRRQDGLVGLEFLVMEKWSQKLLKENLLLMQITFFTELCVFGTFASEVLVSE